MKKGLAALILLVVVLLVGGWWFFTYGGTSTPPPSDEQQATLKIQDKRLSKGTPEAPVKIVEYVDILCPFCAKASQPGEVIPRMIEEYVDTKKAHYEVRLVAKTSPDSERAGEGAYCAAEQDKFWPYIDKAYNDTWKHYYSQNKDVSEVPLFRRAEILGFVRSIPEIDHLKWQRCMSSNDYAQTMKTHSDEMVRLEAYGTPTMVVDGKSYTGTPPYSAFRAVINASLKEKSQGEKTK